MITIENVIFGVQRLVKFLYRKPHKTIIYMGKCAIFSQTSQILAIQHYNVIHWVTNLNKYNNTHTTQKIDLEKYYFISHNKATPLNVQCLGLLSVSKSIEPTYLRSVLCGFL